ncbi:class I SAM-dependent methyltransferase [Mucilaginibacter glaciei]|uniref:Class I SAM-dependent methyltransferase n=1 Tax=Mucilaginibacter glaciei TaxID=2772109 RepID=A0A926S301_9SPHI|nr:class I SAM-dependent methyltransferase [Mucilaginibacter glaciei]MBD1394703.1 class I SAM-dependent methyltransferase [Mucilaginibacter glaciei]
MQYYKCTYCGSLQTEKPYWLDEAYETAITATDIGLLNRNITLSNNVFDIISKKFNTNSRFLDFGGGYGVLVRLLRDKGLDFYRQDIYCQNIFAVNYDISDLKVNELKFEAATCFEVFEHVTDPYKLLEELLAYSSNILISTTLVPGEINSPTDWWYIAQETGQHITFYSLKSLEIIADRYHLNLYSNGENLHLFTRKKFDKNPLIPNNSIIDKVKNKVVFLLKKSTQTPIKSLTEYDLNNAKLIASNQRPKG